MRILLTNDDGITAPGLLALYRAIKPLGEVTVVAPAKVQSATSHAVTHHRALTVDDHQGHHFIGHAVDGRPADCVKLGIGHLMKKPPDLVISGMNRGANVGVCVLYSGTIGAATEAAILGYPAIAVSLHIGDGDKTRWDAAAAHARAAIDAVLAHRIDRGSVVNINIPILDDDAEPRGTRVTTMSASPLRESFEPVELDNGEQGYRARGTLAFREHAPGTDVAALFEGYTTLTPLHFDRTLHEDLDRWREYLGVQ